MIIKFSDEQKSIIQCNAQEHIKVIAVPGSGKSTVLIARINYLMQQDFKADDILCVMFNDKAVVNFTKDLSELEYMTLPEVKTYHAYARRMLFKLVENGHMKKSNFIPCTRKYRRFYSNVLSDISTSINLNTYDINTSLVNRFIKFVELCKTTLLTPEKVFAQYNFKPEHLSFIKAFSLSEISRKDKNIQFFSDLIYDLVKLNDENPQLGSLLSNQYRIVLVDEYQDANAACHKLINMVVGNRASVNVVGDDDQTIYDFSGASPAFLKNIIDTDYPSIKSFSLSKTYRYGHSIALIANNIITNNNHRIDKLCVSGRNQLDSIISSATYDSLYEDTEQKPLINEITQFILEGGSYDQIAVLVRNYSSTFAVEIAFLKHGIPYFINKESHSVLHSDDALFLSACLASLSDIEVASESEITQGMICFLKSYHWVGNKVELSFVVNCVLNKDESGALKAFSSISHLLKQEVATGMVRRIKALIKVLKSKDKSTQYRLQRLIKEAGINAAISRHRWFEKDTARKHFNAILTFYMSLSNEPHEAYLTITKLLKEIENKNHKKGIEFCSLHKSKGLAWTYVIMCHCEEGICPSYESLNVINGIEVERRLFYVGVTRAREKITFHIPNDDVLIKSLVSYQGFMHDGDYFMQDRASRFIYESNLLSATQIGKEIFLNNNNSKISNTGNRVNYNQYLRKINKNYRISGLKDSV